MREYLYDGEFGIEAEKERGVWYLKVTYNGYQWTSIPIYNPLKTIPEIVSILSEMFQEAGKDIKLEDITKTYEIAEDQ